MLPEELTARVAVYRQATGHTAPEAITRLIEIGLTYWETDPHFMPERVCGSVRTVIRPSHK